jgi:hypothetical protein
MPLSKAATNTILRLGAAFLIGGTFIAINWWLREVRDPVTLCIPGQQGQTIVLIDKTDKWNVVQSDRLEALVLNVLDSQVRQEERVRVFAFGSSFVPGFKERFMACKPPDGRDCRGFFCSQKKLKDQYEEVFRSPLLVELQTLKIATYGDCSPIAEVLYDVMGRIEVKNQPGPTRIVLISDMAQNTPVYTAFKGPQSCPGVTGKVDPDKDPGLLQYFGKKRSEMQLAGAAVFLFQVTPEKRSADVTERAKTKWSEVFNFLQTMTPKWEKL